MRLTLDLETRSEIDLKKCGVYVYAQDKTTDILCIAFKIDNKVTTLWIPDKFTPLCKDWHGSIFSHDINTLIQKADEIEAHNVSFEAALWHEVMHKRYGFLDLPTEKLRCSAAKASSHALPRSLAGACEALNLSQQKDKDGYRIMLKMCKPRKPTKHNPAFWHEDPEEFKKLCEYCVQDVDSEHELSHALSNLSKNELTIFKMDHKINTRGINLDSPSIKHLISVIEEKEKSLLQEIGTITDGEIHSVRQIAKTLSWLENQGVTMLNMQKESVTKKLEDDELPSNVRKLLQIRQALGKSSVSKLSTMKKWTCEDGRIRGTLLYYGANTGRWSGKGVQPHNYPRKALSEIDINSIGSLSQKMIDIIHGCTIQAASKCLRGMFIPKKDHFFFCGDFSAIEARVLGWVSGQTKILKAFREGLDLYKVAATEVYGTEYDKITDEQRSIGKLCTLALGYQGHLGAFEQIAKGSGISYPKGTRPKLLETLKKELDVNLFSEDDTEKELFRVWAVPIITKWRATHPKITMLWKGIESAAIKSIETNSTCRYDRIVFRVCGNFLYCDLPSNRSLCYYSPSIKKTISKYGQVKDTIHFMGVDSITKRWIVQTTYGGKLTENIVQALARDVLVESMLQLEHSGYPIVMHVHDEIICEMPLNTTKTLSNFLRIMGQSPAWGIDLPISAEGWEGKRYKKG